jgi:hypothetical protein
MLIFAQSKPGSFIKEHLYIKISPSIFFADGLFRDFETAKSPASPAILGTVGVKIRWAALGFSAGYLHFSEAGKVVPWGADLTITDFKRKIFPVITAQWHQVQYVESYSAPGTGFHTNTITGKNMQSIGAGLTITVLKKLKIMPTVGFSRLNYNMKAVASVYQGDMRTYYYKKHDYMPFIAVSFVH